MVRTIEYRVRVNFVNQVTDYEDRMDEQLRDYFALESFIINPRRPHSDPEIRVDHKWYHEPAFLKENPSTWPIEKPVASNNTGEEHTFTVKELQSKTKFRDAIPQRFSKWERLLRATARVLHFFDICRNSKEKIFYKRTRRHIETDPTWRNEERHCQRNLLL